MPLASDHLALEAALLKLQTSGKSQAITKNTGWNYFVDDTRKYYASSAVSLNQAQSSFVFVCISMCLLFVVIGIQICQRRGKVIAYSKVLFHTDFTLTFHSKSPYEFDPYFSQ